MVVSPRQLQPRKPQNVSFICTQDLSTYIEVWTKRRTRDWKCPVSSWVSGKVRDMKSTDDFLTSFTTVFVDTRLWKRKHPRKRFQNFRQSCVLSRSEGHTSGCDWWISIRSVDNYNMHDWRKFWKRFRGCFVFESRVSTKTVVIHKYAYFIYLFFYFATQNILELIELKA